MEQSTIRSYVLDNVEALPDFSYGPRYRLSATLTDGTYLPCVVVGSESTITKLAIRRFQETALDKGVVTSFICSGNHINHYDIASLSISPFAIPLRHLKNIGGETSMGWTQFQVLMDDDVAFSFGTTFRIEFFSMPDGYSVSRIKQIRPAVRGELPSLHPVYREKLFFECFIKGI